MNIDDARWIALHKLRRQDLHISGEHYQFDTLGGKYCVLFAFGLEFGSGCYGDMPNFTPRTRRARAPTT